MAENDPRTRFALVMSEAPGAWRQMPPQRTREVLDRYFEWVDALVAQGVCKGGDGLFTEGATRVKVADGVVVDGPFAETKEIVAGFFLIDARDAAEATRLARGCPALGHGRTVDVKEIPGERDDGDPGILHEPSRRACAMILVYEPVALAGLSPQRQQILLEETLRWVEGLRSRGILRYGEPLEPGCTRLSAQGETRPEEALRLAAMYALALPIEAAVEVARAYPGLRDGVVLDVQRVWDVNDDR